MHTKAQYCVCLFGRTLKVAVQEKHSEGFSARVLSASVVACVVSTAKWPRGKGTTPICCCCRRNFDDADDDAGSVARILLVLAVVNAPKIIGMDYSVLCGFQHFVAIVSTVYNVTASEEASLQGCGNGL